MVVNLQCGRGESAADSCFKSGPAVASATLNVARLSQPGAFLHGEVDLLIGIASMWPRPAKPRSRRPTAGWPVGYPRFNEAAVLQPRKYPDGFTGRKVVLASMRPRFFNRGNELMVDGDRHRLVASMRSRFFNRENARHHRVRDQHHRASMWPRSISRGNAQGEHRPHAPNHASMRAAADQPREIARL